MSNRPKSNKYARRYSCMRRTKEDGIVMVIALVALVAMTFAVFAMLRSSGASLGVAGNIAFKQNATAAADKGVETATAWILSQTLVALRADAAPGYFATWDASFDPLTYAWSGLTSATVAADAHGNNISYVIHRLCANAGSATGAGQSCVKPSPLNNLGGSGLNRSGNVASNSSGGGNVGGGGGGASGGVVVLTSSAYYRITTRVAGPRNTLGYTQVVIY